MRLPILDTPARRIGAAALALLTIAVIVVGVLAITGSGPLGGNDNSNTPEARVRTTVEEFIHALDGQDFGTACGLLTTDLRAQLGGTQCEQALVALAGQGSSAPQVQITDVRISGNKAAVDANITGAGSGTPAQHTLDLLEENGRWQISSLGG